MGSERSVAIGRRRGLREAVEIIDEYIDRLRRENTRRGIVLVAAERRARELTSVADQIYAARSKIEVPDA